MAAELIVAGIAATLQAVQTWYQVRDSRRASEQLDQRDQHVSDPDVKKTAAELVTIVPLDVLDAIEARLNKCWTGYKKVLDHPKDYTPDETDDATNAVIKCVCREVMKVHQLNGGEVPDGVMRKFFERYKCGEQ